MSSVNNRNRKLQDLIGNEHLGRFQEKTMCFLYDFSVLGGAASALTLTDTDGNAQALPDNAMITSASWDVVTAFTSGGSATVALGWTGTAAGILATTNYNHASVVAATQTSSLAINGKMSAATNVLMTIATTTLTAGKMYLYINYVEGF